jgi:ABC-type antimicrobial peptide transport system permease subunit
MVGASEARRRFALAVLEAFAALALVLAGVGLYGVLAGSVSERTREIGVRAALGASRKGLRVMVVRQAMGLTGLGVAFGLLGAAIGSSVLASLVFGVSRLDPLTYGSVVGVLMGVAAVAAWVPAARASRVDPVRTLRAD